MRSAEIGAGGSLDTSMFEFLNAERILNTEHRTPNIEVFAGETTPPVCGGFLPLFN
jgi:hypothetical protein